MVKICKFLSFVIALTLFLPAIAQVNTGTITGRIVDPQGAVVVGAAVTVTSTTTSVAHAEQTNQDGLYTVPLLLPGTYTVSVVMPNFKTELRNNITLHIGQTLELDFSLSVGATTQTVTVTTAAPLTSTESAAVGTVIDNQKVVEIPLVNRQFYSLTYLVPGVMPPEDNDRVSQRGGFSVGGQQETSNYDSLDGFDNVTGGVATPSYRSSIDDIQEFRVLSGTFEAQYGHNIGGQIIVTSKSGGNAFHGDVFEFVRNQVFNAENYFNPLNVKPVYVQNDWGGTVGGPIIHNKFFFFLSYEGLLQQDTFITESTVPTTAELDGNFTSDATALNAPTGYNPLVFSGNVINTTYMTTAQLQAYNVAKVLLAYYPPDANTGANNFNYIAPERQAQEQGSLRLDAAINASNSVFSTLNFFTNPDTTTQVGTICAPPYIPGFPCYVGTTAELYGGGWTHLFTPNLINSLRAGLQRWVNPTFERNDTVNIEGPLGIPNDTVPGAPDDGGPPSMSITGYVSYGGKGFTDTFNNVYDYADSMLYSKGSHSFNLGVEVIRLSSNIDTIGGLGSFTFNGQYTGNPVADSVLGLPEVASLSPSTTDVNMKEYNFSGYVQDTWKVNRYLTLNYGLRWEKNTPQTVAGNRFGSFEEATGEVVLAGVNGQPDHLWRAQNDGWGPRLGLSWRPFKTDETVIQAGFGITYDTPNLENNFYSLVTTYPIEVTETYDGTVAAPLSLPNPYKSTGSASLNVAGVVPNWVVPMNVAYTFGVQQQVARNTVVTLTYQGSETSHETDSYNINQAQPQATVAEGLADRPWPQWNAVTEFLSNEHSSYNALYVKVQQNLMHGLSFLVAYTWSKSIDNDIKGGGGTQPENIYNPRSDRGLSPFDVRNRLVASPVYQLPWGAGRQFLHQGWVSKIVGGWELAAEISLQDGTPETPLLGTNVSNDGLTSGDRPNVTGNPNNGPKKLTEWFNTSVYSKPASGTFGNAGRDTISSPGYEDVDANIARTFLLPRKMSVQFRAEFFNLLNHPNFEMPGTTYGTSSFGVVSTTLPPRQAQFAFKLYF